jgi:hypothetical protein
LAAESRFSSSTPVAAPAVRVEPAHVERAMVSKHRGCLDGDRFVATVDLETALRWIAFGQKPGPTPLSQNHSPAPRPEPQLTEEEREVRARASQEEWRRFLDEDSPDEPHVDDGVLAVWQEAEKQLLNELQHGRVRERTTDTRFWGHVGTNEVEFVDVLNTAIRKNADGSEEYREGLSFCLADILEIVPLPQQRAPQCEQELIPEAASERGSLCGGEAPNRRRGRPPGSGEFNDDEALEKMHRLVVNEGLSAHGAAHRLVGEGKVHGNGTGESKARRLLKKYQRNRKAV